jgi:hypothetical protein
MTVLNHKLRKFFRRLVRFRLTVFVLDLYEKYDEKEAVGAPIGARY